MTDNGEKTISDKAKPSKGNKKELDKKKDLSSSGENAVLKDRYVIHCAKPLNGLDSPSSKAFEVTDSRSSVRKLFAYVSNVQVLPRLSIANALRGFSNKGMLPYVASGYTKWPETDRCVFIVIYERPMGGKVMPNLKETIEPFSEKDLINAIKPLVGALKDFATLGICHRAIRPDNVFYMDREKTRMVFGDCISVSPAYEQPSACETIPSMMCVPAGRGMGTYANDMYAFGAMALMFSVGKNPVSEKGDKELLQMKIERGSYSSMVGDEKISLSVMEMLRGLLVDDVSQRWDIEALELWVNGRRMSPVQAKSTVFAQRSFTFNKKEYYDVRKVSQALYDNWEQAGEVIFNGKIEMWLRRGFEDTTYADGIARILDTISIRENNKKKQRDIAISMVCMYLDRGSPIRYKKLSFMPDGFSDTLYRAMIRGDDTTDYMDALKYGLVEDWCDFNDMKSLIPLFLPIKKHAHSTKMGGGVERCLYELNEKAPCLSRLVIDEMVFEIKALLPALDKKSKKVKNDAWPVDRHIAAFIATKIPKKVREQVEALNSTDPAMATAGMISMLAAVQWNHGPEAVYGLTSWVGGLVGPVVDSYKSKTRRRMIERNVSKVVRTGKVYELYNLIDSIEERNEDTKGYENAKKEFLAAKKEIKKLDAGKKNRIKEAKIFGHQVAAVTSVAISILTMVIMFIMRIM